MERVAIIGASPKADRYSYRAQQLLTEHGHQVYPVTPKGGEILGVPAVATLKEIDEPIDTVTLYVAPQHQEAVIESIIEKKPRRVIFNPGTECEESERRLKEAGIEVEEACTLVLLNSGQF